MADFLEKTREQQSTRTKLYKIIFLVASLLVGGVLFFQVLKSTETTPFISEGRCDFNKTASYPISVLTQAELVAKISEIKNISDDSIKPVNIGSGTEGCSAAGQIAFWFVTQDSKSKFLYCSADKNLIEYSAVECEKVSIAQTLKDSYKSIIGFLRGGRPTAPS